MDMKPLALIATLALSFNAYAAGGHHHGTGSVEAAVDGGQRQLKPIVVFAFARLRQSDLALLAEAVDDAIARDAH